MSGFPRFTELTASLPATVPFVGPETQERARGAAFDARIGANENGFGPSPKVQAAIAQAAGDIWKYPDPECHDLIEALAGHLRLTANNAVIGEGIDGLLGLIVRMIVEKDTPVVTSLGAYPTFNYHVAGFGGRLVTVPYRDDKEDMDALLDAVKRENAPLVYLANPDNPMGSWHQADAVAAFVEALPETTMLVLDEAYGECAPTGANPVADAFINKPNVIRARTFSKAYGMAGMRVGYAFGHDDSISAFNKVRNHFGVGRLTQIAAIAALEDQSYLRDVLARIDQARTRIGDIAAANGLQALPSATNFVAIDCGRDGEYAGRVMANLIAQGVFVRMPGVAPMNRCIRVSVAPEEELAIFERLLPDALKAAE